MHDIEALKQGLDIAFEDIYRQFHQKLYFFFLKHTADQYMAEELTQITFMRLWLYRSALSDELGLPEQLFRIAKTSLIDALRKNKNERKKVNAYRDQQIEERTAWPFHQFDLARQLHNGINAMPPVQQKVFRLSRMDGLSHKEIADHLSISPKSVEKHITKALKVLKELISVK